MNNHETKNKNATRKQYHIEKETKIKLEIILNIKTTFVKHYLNEFHYQLNKKWNFVHVNLNKNLI